MQNKYITQELNQNNQISYQITHPLFSASISQFGGQLLSFTPNDKADVLWLSNSAITDGSKPIRGGVPICWPWFGPAQSPFKGEPQHGYIRSVNWQITLVEETDQTLCIELKPELPAELVNSLKLDVKLVYRFTDSATIELHTTNLGDSNFVLGAALHTYFNVTDVTQTHIAALDNCQYIDKLAHVTTTQSGKLLIDKPLDRIYLHQDAKLSIATPSRMINLKHTGHDSVVVWTPWQTGAEKLADFDDLGYLSMLCIEAAVTQGYVLEPKQSHVLVQEISVG